MAKYMGGEQNKHNFSINVLFFLGVDITTCIEALNGVVRLIYNRIIERPIVQRTYREVLTTAVGEAWPAQNPTKMA